MLVEKQYIQNMGIVEVASNGGRVANVLKPFVLSFKHVKDWLFECVTAALFPVKWLVYVPHYSKDSTLCCLRK